MNNFLINDKLIQPAAMNQSRSAHFPSYLKHSLKKQKSSGAVHLRLKLTRIYNPIFYEVLISTKYVSNHPLRVSPGGIGESGLSENSEYVGLETRGKLWVFSWSPSHSRGSL